MIHTHRGTEAHVLASFVENVPEDPATTSQSCCRISSRASNNIYIKYQNGGKCDVAILTMVAGCWFQKLLVSWEFHTEESLELESLRGGDASNEWQFCGPCWWDRGRRLRADRRGNSNDHFLHPWWVEKHQNAQPWKAWATIAKDHIRFHICQARIWIWLHSGYRHTETGQIKIWKTSPGLLWLPRS